MYSFSDIYTKDMPTRSCLLKLIHFALLDHKIAQKMDTLTMEKLKPNRKTVFSLFDFFVLL